MAYYVVYIFYMANLQGNDNLISSVVQYAAFIIFSSVMFFFVVKIGRQDLLVWGAVAMGFCHFVVGGTLGPHYEHVPGMSTFFALIATVMWLAILRWR